MVAYGISHRMSVAHIAFVSLLKEIMSEPGWFIHNTVAPLIFTLVALTFFKVAGKTEFALFAVFGAGVAGMWATALFGCGDSIGDDRWQGTLEYMYITPSKLADVIAGRAIAYALIGLILMFEVLVLASVFFGIPLGIANPAAFLAALVLTIISFASIGLVFAPLFVLIRQWNAYANALEGFLFAVGGIVYPVTILPSWVQVMSYGLSPTWGSEAIRTAARLPGLPIGYFYDLLFVILATAAYMGISWYLFKLFERRVREKGELGEF